MLDLIGFLGTVENLINKNNTTTSSYNVSLNLKKKIAASYKGTSGMSGKLPVLISAYPVFFVEAKSAVEEFNCLGRSGKRQKEITYDIISVTHYACGSNTDDTRALEKAQLENLRMTQNIENLLRNYPKLSTTAAARDNQVLKNDLNGTTYFIQENESTYNVMSRITCKALIYT